MKYTGCNQTHSTGSVNMAKLEPLVMQTIFSVAAKSTLGATYWSGVGTSVFIVSGIR